MAVPEAAGLSTLKKDQVLLDFRVANLYCDPGGKVVGVKLWHASTGAPVFLFLSDSVPQVFMWVDTPATSNQGLPHALEHLLAGKGTKGRYSTLLKGMRLSASSAATTQDFNYFSFSSGAGLEGFFEQFHAWLDALYRPDFTDAEAETEFYHFGVVTDPATKKKTLVEKGTVYDEMQPRQELYTYYFASTQQAVGKDNPFGFDSSGVVDEMRGVTPEEIRRFYNHHYRLGSTTGFIFSISPKENAIEFLNRVSRELRPYSEGSSGVRSPFTIRPKYPIHASESFLPRIYNFPSANDTGPGEVLFAWPAVENTSVADLKLLQLLLRGLAEGEQSLLYRSLVDRTSREFDSGATNVGSAVFLANSPYFPISRVGISGIPGKRISSQLVEQLRNLVLNKLTEISEYPDRSDRLVAFNKVITAKLLSEHRSEIVWTKSPPLFGVSASQTAWKDHLECLEMDHGFMRSLSEEPAWRAVIGRLKSGNNIWHDLIGRFHLLQVPYATASAPSPQLLEAAEQAKQDRIKRKIAVLMEHYETSDEQEALSRLEHEELLQAREIDQIETKVARVRFTDHPPLTPDDDIRFRQIRLDGIPVVASIFDRPPTIDIGLSFDLARIPRRYYKFLPLLPRCLDSLGLDEGGQVVTYSELLGEIHEQAYDFSITYPYDSHAKKAELTIRASASDTASFRETLDLIRKMMRFNFLELSNADRLRDIVAQNISSDDHYFRQADMNWVYGPVIALRHQDNPLFLAVSSHFTRAHWNSRLSWLLHRPVEPAAIDDLTRFANDALANSSNLSRAQVSEKLDRIRTVGLESELVEYWLKHFADFPDSELEQGLRELTAEVQQDLRTGPAKTIADLKELQRLILDRRALRVDLTLSPQAFDELQPALIHFLKLIPAEQERESIDVDDRAGSVLVKLEKEHPINSARFPLYVGFVNPDQTSGDAVFFSDFPDYTQVDHKSLMQVLSSNLVSGAGPHGFFMKTWEAGLAYSNGLSNDPDTGLLQYYADRSPDLPSLLEFVNSMARRIDQFQGNDLVEYALSQTFSFSRNMLAPAQRGQLLAQDIRDGTQPQKVRRFSEAILELRKDPHLLSELKQLAFDSICGVLLTEDCRRQQEKARSIFFFAASEPTLVDVERRLSTPHLWRIYPSDYWME